MYFYTLTEEFANTVTRDFVIFSDVSHAFGPVNALIGAEFGKTISRDIGYLLIGPFSNEFSGEFNARDSILEFGSTASESYTLQIEVLPSAAGGAVTPMEFGSGAGILRDVLVPIEWLAGINSNDSVGPIEWKSTISLNGTVPVFWLSQFNTDRVVPIEWGLSVRRDTTAPIEFGMGRRNDALTNVEWRSQFTYDVSVPTELNALALWSPSTAVDWSATPVMNAVAPVEWSLSARLDAIVPLELNMGPYRDFSVPVDWSQPAQTAASAVVGIEFVSRIFQFYTPDMDFGGGKFYTTVVPAEWGGATGVSSDTRAAVEWRGPVFNDANVNTEWRSTLNVDAVAPTFMVSSYIASATIPSAFGATGQSTITVPAEWGNTARLDYAVPLEMKTTLLRDSIVTEASAGSASGATGDASVPLSFSGGVAQLNDVSVESSASLTLDTALPNTWITSTSIDYVQPLEVPATSTMDLVTPGGQLSQIYSDARARTDWSFTGVSATMSVDLETLRNRSFSTVAAVSWHAPISQDVMALVEWAQGTAIEIGDASVPMEVLSLSTVDIVVNLERLFGRNAFGASMEPDEWEREHE